MNKQKLTLGRALAILKNNGSPEAVQSTISSQEAKLFQSLRDRRESLLAAPEEVERVLQSIPPHCCREEQPRLHENTDFFVAYVLIEPRNGRNDNHYLRLMKHLNDCYRCFEEYSAILRDYYNQSQLTASHP
ncbi:MAG: hypothetical protein ACE5HO_14895 [bacterium]